MMDVYREVQYSVLVHPARCASSIPPLSTYNTLFAPSALPQPLQYEAVQHEGTSWRECRFGQVDRYRQVQYRYFAAFPPSTG